MSQDIATQQLDFEHEQEKFLKIAFTWQASTLQTTSSLYHKMFVQVTEHTANRACPHTILSAERTSRQSQNFRNGMPREIRPGCTHDWMSNTCEAAITQSASDPSPGPSRGMTTGLKAPVTPVAGPSGNA